MDVLSKMEQVKALGEHTDVQFILNEAYKILENPIAMFDTNYGLLSYTEGIVTDDPVWNELIAKGCFCLETRELFMEEGFTDDVANAGTICFLVSDKLKYDRISGKIFNRDNVHVANLVIVACGRKFMPEDAALFEAVCRVVTEDISSSEHYTKYGKAYNETLIKKLLDGSIVDKGLYSAHVAILYDGLKDNLYLAVVEAAEAGPKYAELTRLKRLLSRKLHDAKYSIFSKYIIVIMSYDSPVCNIKESLGKLEGFLSKNNMYAGISSCFGNLFELPRYYNEALNALGKGLEGDTGERIFPFDNVGK